VATGILVQLVTIKWPISGGQSGCLSHDLGNRPRGPVERMRLLIPFSNALFQLSSQVVFGCNVGDFQTVTWPYAEPLFHLLQPRALPGRAVQETARMLGSPLSDRLPVMRADVVAHERHLRDLLINLVVPLVQTGHAFVLTCALITWPRDLARAGIKSRQAMERPGALVRVLAPVGKVPGLSRQG
jgi:hypothetical protein